MTVSVSTSWYRSREVDEPFYSSIKTVQRDRAVYRFAAFQLLSTIYLQKIAVGTLTFQVRVPLILVAAGVAWAIITGTASFAPARVGLYLAFVGSSLFSVICSGFVGSLPSIFEMWLMYFFFTISMQATPDTVRKIMRLFVVMMILPCAIVWFQYNFQKLVGRPDPFNMNEMLPKQFLLQGYYYNEHYPFWYSKFTRPNGFFFLEPSFMSQYAALAAIVEVLYFRRPLMVLFFVTSVIFSTGATGVVTLAVAAPFLLAREPPKIVATVLIVGAIGVAVGAATDQLPFLSRIGEFNHQSSSGSDRMLVPAEKFVEFIFDPSYLLTGIGPGNGVRGEIGNGWAIVKLVYEYGLATVVTYMALFIATMAANGENLPMKAAIFFVFQFTGGYLLDVNAVNFIVVTCLFNFPRSLSLQLVEDRWGTT